MCDLVLILEKSQVLLKQEIVDEAAVQLRFAMLGNPEDRLDHIRCLLPCLVRGNELLNLLVGLVLLRGKVKERRHAHNEVGHQ